MEALVQKWLRNYTLDQKNLRHGIEFFFSTTVAILLFWSLFKQHQLSDFFLQSELFLLISSPNLTPRSLFLFSGNANSNEKLIGCLLGEMLHFWKHFEHEKIIYNLLYSDDNKSWIRIRCCLKNTNIIFLYCCWMPLRRNFRLRELNNWT